MISIINKPIKLSKCYIAALNMLYRLQRLNDDDMNTI